MGRSYREYGWYFFDFPMRANNKYTLPTLNAERDLFLIYIYTMKPRRVSLYMITHSIFLSVRESGKNNDNIDVAGVAMSYPNPIYMEHNIHHLWNIYWIHIDEMTLKLRHFR